MTEAPGRPAALQPLLVLAVLAAAFWDGWKLYAARVAASPEEALPLALTTGALIGMGGFKLVRARNLHAPPLPLLAGLLALYAVAVLFAPPLVRIGLAVGACLVALHWVLFGRPPAAFLGTAALVLPLLPTLEFLLAWPLRLVSAFLTVTALQAGGLAVAQEGVALIWRDERILFDAPCSGVRMLWAGLLLASGTAWLERLRPGRYLAALVLAGALAVLGNVMRAASLFYIEAGLVEVPLVDAHAWIGLVAFAFTGVATVFAVRRLGQRA